MKIIKFLFVLSVILTSALVSQTPAIPLSAINAHPIAENSLAESVYARSLCIGTQYNGYTGFLTKRTAFERDKLFNSDYGETVYEWIIPEQKHYPGSLNLKKSFLLRNGMYKETPDGITYNLNGEVVAEYYKDAEGKKYCFFVNVWKYTVYTKDIFCAVVNLDQENIIGNLLFNFDKERGTTQERLYYPNGKLAAKVTYEYIPGFPFPLVTDYWNEFIYNEEAILCRDQKTWFYKARAQFDGLGRVTAFSDYTPINDHKEYLSGKSSIIYNSNGTLDAIEEELLEEDIERGWGNWDDSIDYSGQIKMNYNASGNISHVDYLRSSYTHGTSDSDGTIYYDDKGRIIANDYYMTHGWDVEFFLYEGDAVRPWACLHWCSFGPGFEVVRVFQPE